MGRDLDFEILRQELQHLTKIQRLEFAEYLYHRDPALAKELSDSITVAEMDRCYADLQK